MFGELPFAAMPFAASTGIYLVSVAETVTGQDSTGSDTEALWDIIDTSQTPGWGLIPTIPVQPENT